MALYAVDEVHTYYVEAHSPEHARAVLDRDYATLVPDYSEVVEIRRL